MDMDGHARGKDEGESESEMLSGTDGRKKGNCSCGVKSGISRPRDFSPL